MSKKKYSYIKEEPISAAGPNGTTVKKEGFIPLMAEDIKVEQIDPAGAKKNQEIYFSWVNQVGAKLKQWPDGRFGFEAEMEDGTKKYWILGQDGEVRKYKKYFNGEFYVEDWKRKLDRAFGITDKMWAEKSNKIDMIHAIEFFTLIVLPLLAIAVGGAWWLRSIFG